MPAPAAESIFDKDARDVLSSLRGAMHAGSTKSARSVAVGLFADMCEKKGVTPFPLQVDSVELFAAYLAANGQQTTARAYISHLRTENKLRHHELTKADENYLTLVNNALKRDAGQDSYAPVGAAVLLKMRKAIRTEDDEKIWSCAVVQMRLVMRPEEIIGAVVEVNRKQKTATVTIPRSKTDKEAVGRSIKIRKMGCALCPFGASIKIAEDRPTLSAYRKGFQTLLRKAGVRNDTGANKKMKPYQLHGLRKGGAQAYILNGHPRDTVQKLGGWKSRESLLRYEAEVLLNPTVDKLELPLDSAALIKNLDD